MDYDLDVMDIARENNRINQGGHPARLPEYAQAVFHQFNDPIKERLREISRPDFDNPRDRAFIAAKATLFPGGSIKERVKLSVQQHLISHS
jgi:hypothetical protein